MSISTVMDYLLGLFKLESQSIFGGVRFLLTLVMFPTLLAKFDTSSGRLGFACSSEADDKLTRDCFSKYSADVSSFMYPNTFIWVTIVALFVLWCFIILYSSRNLKKIRKTGYSEKEQLCHELWEKSLLHVCCEALVIILILIFFYCTQEISLPETYNCTVWNASKEIVQTCEDVHHWEKSKLNRAFIFIMAVLIVLCFATIFDIMCNKEHFIKDLLDLNTKKNEADGNHHRNTQLNANDAPDGFTNTSNHNEKLVAPVKLTVWNIDAAQVPEDVCRDLAYDISLDWKKLGRQLGISEAHLKNIAHQNHEVYEQSLAILNKWRERAGEEATVGVLREALEEIERKDLSNKVRDKMLAKQQLPLTEGALAAWNTKTGYTDSSRQFTFDTSPNHTETTPSESAAASLSGSPSLINSIRHRKGGGDSGDSDVE